MRGRFPRGGLGLLLLLLPLFGLAGGGYVQAATEREIPPTSLARGTPLPTPRTDEEWVQWFIAPDPYDDAGVGFHILCEKFDGAHPPHERAATILRLCRRADRITGPEASKLRGALLCYLSGATDEPSDGWWYTFGAGAWNLAVERQLYEWATGPLNSIFAADVLVCRYPWKYGDLAARWLDDPDERLREMAWSLVYRFAPSREQILKDYRQKLEARGEGGEKIEMIEKALQQIAAGQAPPIPPAPSPSPTVSPTPSPPAATPPLPAPESHWSPGLIPGIFAGLGLLSAVLIVVLFRRR